MDTKHESPTCHLRFVVGDNNKMVLQQKLDTAEFVAGEIIRSSTWREVVFHVDETAAQEPGI